MKKRSRVPITASLFSVTLVVALTLAATIIAYTHYSNRDTALTAGRELMKRSAQVVRLRTEGLIAPIDAIARYSRDWLDVNAVPTVSGHPSRKKLISFLGLRNQISSIYIGHENGSNYLIGAARTRPADRLEKMGAPEETVFLEQIILRGDRPGSLRIRRFLDKFGGTISTRTDEDIKYDPRTRPWYRLAQESDDVVRTEVYLFAGTGEPGFTVSKRHSTGVVGVDVTLDDLDSFLDSEPQAEQGVLAIIDDKGVLLARSGSGRTGTRNGNGTGAGETGNGTENGNGTGTRNGTGNGNGNGIEREAALTALLAQVNSVDSGKIKTIDVNGRTWVTHLSEIELGAGAVENLAIAVPLATVIGPITQASHRTILVSIIIALCSIPFVWMISRSMSRPLKRLALETRDLSDFNLDEPFVQSSAIDEIFRLEVAMERMRSALRIFGLYVPKTLVRQMIEREQEPELGGANRDITVMFMDLENFTAMSSRLEPEEVMRRMSRYFEIVTQTLLAHEATIDKYIGDAVMAFWNAPNDVADHPKKACDAALAVIEATRAETDSWYENGGLPLRTRIGIHSGEAIIGNVGSSDRMNYTALGSTVNLAARLESLNRDLGTTILISADLASRVEGRFLLKPAGHTNIKGFDKPVEVFELDQPAPGESHEVMDS